MPDLYGAFAIMRSFLSVCIFVLATVLVSSSVSRAQSGSLTDGLVVHLSFDDGNANDSSGNGNNGTANNVTYVPGARSTSARFNGTTSYISISHSTSLNLTTSFTFSGWVKLSSVANRSTSYVAIFTRGDTSSYATAPYSVVFRNLGNGNLVPHARFNPSTGRQIIDDLNINNALSFDRWSFFTWKLDQGVLTVYRDGKKIGESSLALSSIQNVSSPLEIGRDAPGLTEFLRGDIDELRIYNRALRDEEIQELYNQGSVYFVNLPLTKR